MMEFQLKQPISYNECNCKCSECHFDIVRVSTEDLEGLEQLMQERNVRNAGSVALNIKQKDSYGNLPETQ